MGVVEVSTRVCWGFLCIYSILLCIVIILYVMIKRMDKLIVPTVMPHRQTD